MVLLLSGIKMGSNNQKCCFSSRAYFVPLTLILPSMICQQSSALSLLSLFESQIFSVASSHNSHLLHTFFTHDIFIVVLSINDKHSLSIKYLPTVRSERGVLPSLDPGEPASSLKCKMKRAYKFSKEGGPSIFG